MSAITKDPGYFDRTTTWMRGKWTPADFRPVSSRCYGVESVPVNRFQGVTVGAWVHYRGRVWQVWSWHRQTGRVWLADGAMFTEAEARACEVIGQSSEDVPMLEVAS